MLYFMTQSFVDTHTFDDDSHIAQRNSHKPIYVAQSIFLPSPTPQTPRVLTYPHKLCDPHKPTSPATWILNMSTDLQAVLDAFPHHPNDIDALNIEYSSNLPAAINSLPKSRTPNKPIAAVDTPLDRVKALAVMTIARSNSTRNDIALYSKATKCLDGLAERLEAGIQMNVEEASIVEGCFKAWTLQLADLSGILRIWLCRGREWVKEGDKGALTNDGIGGGGENRKKSTASHTLPWLLTYGILRTCNWRRRALQWWNTIIKTQTCPRRV